jgi:[ribosomal protein S18]-alanine N-acetyltransferase
VENRAAMGRPNPTLFGTQKPYLGLFADTMALVPAIGQRFQIRDFEPSDFETLWEIDQKCFPAGISYSRTELKTYIRRRGSFTLVAVGQANKTVSGFLVAEANRRSGHIITIDVVESARRFGVGSLLLRSAEERLRSAGCQFVELETAVDNISALSFYKRHHYSVVRTHPRYYSNGVDALVLQKPLHDETAPDK